MARRPPTKFQLIFKFFSRCAFRYSTLIWLLQTRPSEASRGRIAKSALEKAKEASMEGQSGARESRGRRGRGRYQRDWVSVVDPLEVWDFHSLTRRFYFPLCGLIPFVTTTAEQKGTRNRPLTPTRFMS